MRLKSKRIKAGREEKLSQKLQNNNLGKKGHSSLPADIKPMLASLVEKPFDDGNWIFEIKWDGYRAIAYLEDGDCELRSRNNLSFTEKFYPVAKSLRGWKINAVFDGEIVCVDEKGRASFQQLQTWQKTGIGKLVYYVFDIIWLNGNLLTDLPLVQRKKILEKIIQETDNIKYSSHIEKKGIAFFKAATEQGLEGIMAKRSDSVYQIGKRTRDWLKIKTSKRQEVVVAGFTEGRNARHHFGALILGLYDKGQLRYVGHTGSGFDERGLEEIYKKLKPLITPKCPFATEPKTNMPCTWVKPKLVCEIKFTEWTRDNSMRHPIFMGLREDKNPTEIKKEISFQSHAKNKENKVS